ncbi:hypothetical protein BDV29DRAFT_172701 [Aspergillus leporis]|uniref:Uncharacterized protein n=1 Tax=Aspergillus leporis TaxID=41062 RepID=A0A5N5X4F1_9EURO|nr:hypothetical protein BDV29DRAFT_172701 [Aspergillus leporis]
MISDLHDVPIKPDLRSGILYPPSSPNIWRLTLEGKVADAAFTTPLHEDNDPLYLIQMQNPGTTFTEEAWFFTDVVLPRNDARKAWSISTWKWLEEGDSVKCILLRYTVRDSHVALAVKPNDDDL